MTTSAARGRPVIAGARGAPAVAPALDVLMVSQPTSYGVAVCVRQLTEAAVAAGYEVTVACPGPEEGPLAGWVTSAGATHERLPLVRRPALRDLADVWSIRRLARGRDIVHLHSSKAAALGRVAVASLGSARPAVVVTPHYWSWFVGGRLAPLYRLIERILAPRCDAIIAVSEREASEGRRVLGGAARRITVVHNGVDLDHYSPHGPRAPRDPAPLVVCVGRLSHQKGQDLAIRALALLRSRDARLRLVGDESDAGEKSRLRALAASLGVAGRVEWRGAVTDIAPELRAADVVLAPSRWEGMSLVFLEAMACGAPIVATEVAGSEAATGAAVIVGRDDPAALAVAVDELLVDRARREALAATAARRSRFYDVRSTLQHTLQLWSELAGRGAGVAASAHGRKR